MTNPLAALLVAVVTAAGVLACSDAKRPPDVVLVTLDTTRADHLGAYGYPFPTSPNIDRFARDSVTFTRAWSTSSWTLPSHASMFTGQYPRTHGARFNKRSESETDTSKFVSRLGESSTTLAEILGDRGYETAAFAGGPWLAPEFGLLQGYQHRFAGLDTDLPRAGPKQSHKHLELKVDWTADQLTDHAIEWLERESSKGRPLHLLVNYFDPHAPYDVKPGFRVRAAKGAKDSARAKPRRRVGYDAEIRFMDHHFGRLIDALEKEGRYDNALIIVVADHGESFGERGNFGHGPWLYEEVLRVPLLIHFPGGRDAGTTVDAPVSIVDLLPVIAREIGFPLPKEVEGVDIGTRDVVFSEVYRSAAFTHLSERYDRDLSSVIRWPWKLIVPDVGTPELYRLDEDPGEGRPVEPDASQAEIEKELEQELARMPAPVEPDSAGVIDPKLAQRLRKLGYIP